MTPSSQPGSEKATPRPCPFCGSNKIQVIPNESETEQASCNRCGASGSPVLCGSGQAITEWNRRANINGWDALKEENRRLRAALEKIAVEDCPGRSEIFNDGSHAGCNAQVTAQEALNNGKEG